MGLEPTPLAVRWPIAWLLCGSTVLSNLDRQALSMLAPMMLSALGLNDLAYGTLTGAFLLAYGAGQLIAGPVVDRLGVRRALSWAVPMWSVAAAAHAATSGFVGLILARVALGAVEAANYPAAFKAIAIFFPSRERSLATGIVTAGTGLGAILAPPLFAALAMTGGWRIAFLVPAILGLVWFLVWRAVLRPDAERSCLREPAVSTDEQSGCRASIDATRPRIRDVLRDPVARVLMLARFLADGGVYFLLFWVPQYLSEHRGFDLPKIALFAWIPFVASDCGNLAGGWLGTKLMRRGHTLRFARLVPIWGGAILTLAVAATTVAADATGAIALICIGMFAIQVRTAGLFALPGDLFRSGTVATAWGLTGAAGSLGAALFQPLVGWIATQSGFGLVFVLIPALQLAAAACVTFLIPSSRFERK